MNQEDHVVSLELAREMKELGAEQDSIWVWVESPCRDSGYECRLSWNIDPYLENYSAYTVAELGEMLPLFFASYHTEYDGWQCESPWGFNDRYIVDGQKYHTHERVYSMKPRRLVQEAETEADARAKMWIYLKKEGK